MRSHSSGVRRQLSGTTTAPACAAGPSGAARRPPPPARRRSRGPGTRGRSAPARPPGRPSEAAGAPAVPRPEPPLRRSSTAHRRPRTPNAGAPAPSTRGSRGAARSGAPSSRIATSRVPPMTKVLVVGGGAIGGITAAKLAPGLERVTVLDTNAEHVARLRDPGLVYTERGEEHAVRL